MIATPPCGLNCQLAAILLAYYVVGVLAIAALGVLVYLVRRHGVESILRAVAPLAVVLTLTGCIGPQGDSIFGGTVDWGDYKAPGSSRAAVAAQVATASEGDAAITWDDLRDGHATLMMPDSDDIEVLGLLQAASTTTLTTAQAQAVDAARALYPGMNATAGNLLATAWIDPPVGQVRDWGAWLQRWHGPLSGRPGLTGAAAEADHRASAAQFHGQAIGGLDLCAAHIAILSEYFAARPVDPRTWWPRDDRLAKVSAQCAHAFAAGEPAQPVATSCGVVGWSGGPLPATCDEWVAAGPASGCCWQRVARGRTLVVRCARSCEDGLPVDPPVIDPPPPVDPPVEPPVPEPPADGCTAALDDLQAILDALDAQAGVARRECRP